MNTRTRSQFWILAIPLLVVAALFISGCSSSDSDTDSTASGDLSVGDAWVKATDGEMTGAFGVIKNDTGEEVAIVSATTSASDKTELHETVEKDGESIMQVKDGGFTIAAGESFTLEPGGNHVMIMALEDPIKAGDEVTITLNLGSGDPVEFTGQAKESAAGEEPYHEGDEGMDDESMPSPSSSMDMG